MLQLHDQGAGGNCNVVKEIIYPLGAEIDIRAVKLGDETMSVLEIWGAEYQENDCLLIREADRGKLEAICARERCYMQVNSAPPPPLLPPLHLHLVAVQDYSASCLLVEQ